MWLAILKILASSILIISFDFCIFMHTCFFEGAFLCIFLGGRLRKKHVYESMLEMGWTVFVC